jgi:hypothetical protein
MKTKILILLSLYFSILFCQPAFAHNYQTNNKISFQGITLGMKPYEVFSIIGKPDYKEGNLASKKGGYCIFLYNYDHSNTLSFLFETKNGLVCNMSAMIYKSKTKNHRNNFSFPNNVNSTSYSDFTNAYGDSIDKDSIIFSNGMTIDLNKDGEVFFVNYGYNSLNLAKDILNYQNKSDYGLIVSDSTSTCCFSKENPENISSTETTGFVKNFRNISVDIKIRVIFRDNKTNKFIGACESVEKDVNPNEKRYFSVIGGELYIPKTYKVVYDFELSLDN